MRGVQLNLLTERHSDTTASISFNGFTLGEEADLKTITFSLAQTPIRSTNVQFSTKPAFLPNVCYMLCFLEII
jgi:hypothetical protein